MPVAPTFSFAVQPSRQQVQPATDVLVPVGVGLVVELEDDAAVGREGVRDAGPEVGRVIGVGHRLLADRQLGPRRDPVQLEDRNQAVFVQQRHVGRDGAGVDAARAHRGRAVDPQPARLVERHAHGVEAARRPSPPRTISSDGPVEDRQRRSGRTCTRSPSGWRRAGRRRCRRRRGSDCRRRAGRSGTWPSDRRPRASGRGEIVDHAVRVRIAAAADDGEQHGRRPEPEGPTTSRSDILVIKRLHRRRPERVHGHEPGIVGVNPVGHELVLVLDEVAVEIGARQQVVGRGQLVDGRVVGGEVGVRGRRATPGCAG